MAGTGAIAGEALATLAGRVQPTTQRAEQRLPLHQALVPFLPGGLRRGSTLVVTGSTSLLLLLISAASAAGSWVAAVGLPNLGVLAAAELGVALERLALIPQLPASSWARVAAAALDGIEIVVVCPPAMTQPAHSRRLAALTREQGALLVAVGSWPGTADLHLTATAGRWYGLEQGAGFLRAQRLEVTVTGRAAASRPRRGSLWLPGPDGGPAVARPPD